MADLITLAEAKKHLRVTNDAEDDLITIYIAAAMDYMKNFLNLAFVPINASTKAAGLMLIEGLFEQRGSNISNDIKENPAVKNLLYPYRVKMGI